MKKFLFAVGLTTIAVACGGKNNDNGASSGSARNVSGGAPIGTTGGKQAAGGAATGGKASMGGSSATASSSGGTAAVAGNSALGSSTGATNAGGNGSSTGGASDTTGGATMMSASGMPSMGGSGMMSMGGSLGSGGTSAVTGGANATGGTAAVGTGGMMSAGGTGMMSSGGASSMAGSGTKAGGGTSNMGGNSSAASGGTTNMMAGSLTLTVDDSLVDTGDAGTPSLVITAAVLLNKLGATVATASINSGSAVFSLVGVSAGDYFVEVNDDTINLVPTRIDSSTVNVNQEVAPDLSASYIGAVATPTYRINIYPDASVFGFASGAEIAGEHAYVIVTLTNPQIEFRVLGTAALLSSLNPSATHSSGDQPFDSWLINTPNQDHHGDMYNADPTSCTACHKTMDAKPPTYSAVKPSIGWCFRCHNGTGGPDTGIFDSAQ